MVQRAPIQKTQSTWKVLCVFLSIFSSVRGLSFFSFSLSSGNCSLFGGGEKGLLLCARVSIRHSDCGSCCVFLSLFECAWVESARTSGRRQPPVVGPLGRQQQRGTLQQCADDLSALRCCRTQSFVRGAWGAISCVYLRAVA